MNSPEESQDAGRATPLRRHVRFNRQASLAGSGVIVEIDRPAEPQEHVRTFTNTLGLLHDSQDNIQGVELPGTPLLEQEISIVVEDRHPAQDRPPQNDPWERAVDGRVRYVQHAFIEEYNSTIGDTASPLLSRIASPRSALGGRRHSRSASHLSNVGAVGQWVPGSANSRRSSIATLPLNTVCPPPPTRARLLLPQDIIVTDLGDVEAQPFSPSEDSPAVATPPMHPVQRQIEAAAHTSPSSLERRITDPENLPLPPSPPLVDASAWNFTRPFGGILTNLRINSDRSIPKTATTERDGLSSAGLDFVNPFFGRDIPTPVREHPLRNSCVPPPSRNSQSNSTHSNRPSREASQSSLKLDDETPVISPIDSTQPIAQSTPKSILRKPSITNLRPRPHSQRRRNTMRPDRSPRALRSPRLSAPPLLPSLPAFSSADPDPDLPPPTSATTNPAAPKSPRSKPCPLDGLTLSQLLDHLAEHTTNTRDAPGPDVSSGPDKDATWTHPSSRTTFGDTHPAQHSRSSSRDSRLDSQTGSSEDPIPLVDDDELAPPRLFEGPLYESPVSDAVLSPAGIAIPPCAPLQHVNELLLLKRSDTLLVRDDERMLEHARIGVEAAYVVYSQLSDEVTEHFSSILAQSEINVFHELEEECLAVLKTLEQCKTMLDLRLTENSIVKDSWSSRTTDWYKQHMRRAATLHLVLSRLAGTVYNEDLLAASPSAVLVKLKAYRRKLDDVSKKMTCAFLRLRVKNLHATLTSRHQQDREQRRAQTLAALDPQGADAHSKSSDRRAGKPSVETYSKQQRAEERAWRHSQRKEINSALEELANKSRRFPPSVH